MSFPRQQAIVAAHIRDTRTNEYVFEGLEVSYAVHIDPELPREVRHVEMLKPFLENMNKLLVTLPRGSRVVRNKTHYSVEIEDLRIVTLQ